MATKKTFLPDITESKLTKNLVDILSTYYSNVVKEDGTITQYMFTEDNTIGDMFEFLKSVYPLIWSEYIAMWYGHRNGNTEENYMKYLGVQLEWAYQREFVQHIREQKKTYKRTSTKKKKEDKK